jgi:tetratricopeptide (TPR) repeat protein
VAQSKSKLSRKALKQPDQFQTQGEAVLQNLIDNKKRYLTYAGILVGLMIIYSVAMSYMASRDESLSEDYGQVMRIYNAQVAAKPEEADPTGDTPTFASEEMKYVSASEALEKFIAENSGSGFANAARLYLGNAFFMLKRYDKAREAYQTFLENANGPFDELSFIALNNIAQSLDAEDKLDEASATYQRIVDESEGIWGAEATYNIAQIKKRQGKNEEAIKLLLGLQEKYPDTAAKSKADKLLTVLRGPEPPKPAEEAKPETVVEGG